MLSPLARLLGLAGLLPQVLAVIAVITGDETRFIGLAGGFFYAALILSFIGGLWWGAAASRPEAPSWLYAAAVVPSLIALASGIPWMIGGEWPGPSLVILGLALLASPLVDRKLVALGVLPPAWLPLRLALSVGLGGLTLLLAAL